MDTRRSRRSASAAMLIALLANLVLGAPAGLAGDPDIVITVTPLPPSVTLWTAAQPTYAGYGVLVENKGANRLNDVRFSGETTVTDGGSAPFHSCVPSSIGCTAPTATSMAVTIGRMDSGTDSEFIVVFTAPSSGTAVNFEWTLNYGEGTTDNPNASHADSQTGTAMPPTTISPTSTTETFSFVPATGGTFFTGTGIAITNDSWSTKVSVPTHAEARIQERAPASPTELCLVSTYTCIGDVTTLTIPSEEPFASLKIHLSIDVTRIRPPGRKIADAKIFYQPDAGTAFEVLNCTTQGTLGPDPCISSRIEYTKKNTTNSNLWGDWEFVILASHNGSYRG